MNDLKKNIWIWLSGADPDALSALDTAIQRRYKNLGKTVLIPAVAAWLGMFFAAEFIGITGWPKYLISFIWSFIVLTIDLFLVGTLEKPTTWNRSSTISYIFIAISRLLLSIALGIVISHPLVLRCLDNDITEALSTMKDRDLSDLDSASCVRTALHLKGDTAELHTAQKYLDCLNNLKKAEINGIKIDSCLCGSSSGDRNHGERYDSIISDITICQQTIDKINNRIDSTKKKYDAIAAQERRSLKENYSISYRKRMKAVEVMKADDDKNKWRFTKNLNIALLLFFIFIDTIAVLGKIIMGKSVYETQIKLLRDTTAHKQENLAQTTKFENDKDRDYTNNAIAAVYSNGQNKSPAEIRNEINRILNRVENATGRNSTTSRLNIYNLVSGIIGAVVLSIIAAKKFDSNAVGIYSGVYSLIYTIYISIYTYIQEYGKP